MITRKNTTTVRFAVVLHKIREIDVYLYFTNRFIVLFDKIPAIHKG